MFAASDGVKARPGAPAERQEPIKIGVTGSVTSLAEIPMIRRMGGRGWKRGSPPTGS